MGRNNAPGTMILALESKALSGIPYWDVHLGQSRADDELHDDFVKNAPQKVVNKIVNARRAKVDL